MGVFELEIISFYTFFRVACGGFTARGRWARASWQWTVADDYEMPCRASQGAAYRDRSWTCLRSASYPYTRCSSGVWRVEKTPKAAKITEPSAA